MIQGTYKNIDVSNPNFKRDVMIKYKKEKTSRLKTTLPISSFTMTQRRSIISHTILILQPHPLNQSDYEEV